MLHRSRKSPLISHHFFITGACSSVSSIRQHINHCRIEKAKRLLVSTDQPIAAVSRIVGYADADNFYLLFKKAAGITPMQFRNLFGADG